MLEYIGFIYLWTNKINNKKYIGLHKGTVDDGYIGSGTYFVNAVKKYGIENFERQILYFEFISLENLYIKEYEIINEFNAVKSNDFYNQVNISPNGFKFINGEFVRNPMSEKTKEKLSKLAIGRKHSSETKEKMRKKSQLGKNFYNNGVKNKQYIPGEEPDGWELGFIKGKNHNSGKGEKFYNNGLITKRFIPGEEPPGWELGSISHPSLSGERNPFYGKSHSEESIQKMKETLNGTRNGKNNAAALIWDVYDSENKLIVKCHGEFTKICKEMNLPYSALYKSASSNTKIKVKSNSKIDKKYNNWYCIKYKEEK